MKNGMILAKKKTWRSRLDLDYLDETSERKMSQQERLSPKSSIGQKLKQFGDYASKESLGQVHAGGFLHHLIVENPDGSRTAPSQMTNAERKKRISEAWFNHFRKFPTSSKEPVIQHRLVFSMSKELHDKLVASGINPDRVLQTTMRKIMRKFNDRFHPADAIGYAYGIHHDTDYLHVHVALCPRTQRGAYVGCSTTRSHTSGHKDQMGYLRSCFERENLRWENLLSSPKQLEQVLSQRIDSDKIVFASKLSRFQLEALRNSQTAEAIRLQQLYQSIRNLEATIATKRQYRTAQRNANLVFRLLGRRKPKFTRTIEKLANEVDTRSLREMQNLLFTMKRNYRAAHKRYSQIHGFNSYANRNAQSLAHRQTVQKL
jgi:hypothetical protein